MSGSFLKYNFVLVLLKYQRTLKHSQMLNKRKIVKIEGCKDDELLALGKWFICTKHPCTFFYLFLATILILESLILQ